MAPTYDSLTVYTKLSDLGPLAYTVDGTLRKASGFIAMLRFLKNYSHKVKKGGN
jgi:hypothetical protein